MAGVMDQITPSTPVGPQPNSQSFGQMMQPPGGPGPQAQIPQAKPQSFGGLMGGGQANSPRPSPSPQPQGDQPNEKPEQNDDDDVKKALSAFNPTEAEKKAIEPQVHDKEIQDALAAFKAPNDSVSNGPIVDAQRPNEGTWDYVKRSLQQNGQWIAAQARAGIGSNPQEQKVAWESMYGPDNVKTDKNGGIMVRPDGSAWKKVSQTQIDLLSDFMVKNTLNAIPMLANAATQTATNAAMLPADAATGGAAIPGAAAAGFAAGGAADYAARWGVKKFIDQFSNIPQNSPFSGKDLGIDVGTNVAAGTALHMAAAASEPVAEKAKGLASQAWNELDSFVSRIRGMSNVSDVPKALNPGIAEQTANAVDTLGKQWGEEVGLYKDRAIELAEQADKKIVPTQMMDKLKGILTNREVSFNQDGLAIPKGFDRALPTPEGTAMRYDSPSPTQKYLSQAQDYLTKPVSAKYAGQVSEYADIGEGRFAGESPSSGYGKAFNKFSNLNPVQTVPEAPQYTGILRGNGSTEELASLYNRYQPFMPNASDSANFGAPQTGFKLDRFFNDLSQIGDAADFARRSGSVPRAQVAEYGNLYHAAAADRDGLLNELFQGGGTPDEQEGWKKAYDTYSSRIGAVRDIQKYTNTDAGRSLLVDQLYSTKPGPKQAQALLNMKTVLQDNPADWNAFRGEWVQNLVNDATNQATNIVDPSQLVSRLNKMNPSVLNTIFDPGELQQFKVVAGQADKLATAGAALSASQKSLVQSTLQLGEKIPVAGKGASFLMKMGAGNKAVVDYAIDKGYMDAARQAGTVAEKQDLLQSRTFLQKLTSQMFVGNVRKNGVTIPTYVGSPAMKAGAGSMTNMGAQGALSTLTQPQPGDQ